MSDVKWFITSAIWRQTSELAKVIIVGLFREPFYNKKCHEVRGRGYNALLSNKKMGRARTMAAFFTAAAHCLLMDQGSCNWENDNNWWAIKTLPKISIHEQSKMFHLGFVWDPYWVECCEKYKSFKLKIPRPDSERRHSPDFRTVFGIMIGPFSSCEIGKTWGTNKQTKIENFNIHNQILNHVTPINKLCFMHFVVKSSFVKLEFSQLCT